MSTLTWILAGEIAGAGLIAAFLLAVVIRRRNQRMLAAVTGLLDRVCREEQTRLELLQRNLAISHQLPEHAAQEASRLLLAGEKEFLKGMVQILLTRDMAAVSQLHVPLQELLNRQIKITAELNPRQPPQALDGGIGVFDVGESPSPPTLAAAVEFNDPEGISQEEIDRQVVAQRLALNEPTEQSDHDIAAVRIDASDASEDAAESEESRADGLLDLQAWDELLQLPQKEAEAMPIGASFAEDNPPAIDVTEAGDQFDQFLPDASDGLQEDIDAIIRKELQALSEASARPEEPAAGGGFGPAPAVEVEFDAETDSQTVDGGVFDPRWNPQQQTDGAETLASNLVDNNESVRLPAPEAPGESREAAVPQSWDEPLQIAQAERALAAESSFLERAESDAGAAADISTGEEPEPLAQTASDANPQSAPGTEQQNKSKAAEETANEG